mmetsp:Transcript_31521/g.82925  ORF Transcript_31521/g.82925 Transcript_31521/m.82925 type:complete len:219 (+) Transcript_31521:383-1039(+)
MMASQRPSSMAPKSFSSTEMMQSKEECMFSEATSATYDTRASFARPRPRAVSAAASTKSSVAIRKQNGVRLRSGLSPITGSPTKANVRTRTCPSPMHTVKDGCQRVGGNPLERATCTPGVTETCAATCSDSSLNILGSTLSWGGESDSGLWSPTPKVGRRQYAGCRWPLGSNPWPCANISSRMALARSAKAVCRASSCTPPVHDHVDRMGYSRRRPIT